MKKLFVAALALGLMSSFYTVPVFAIDGGVVPPECNLAATKEAHPGWYRDGGYCSPNNGTHPGYGEVCVQPNNQIIEPQILPICPG